MKKNIKLITWITAIVLGLSIAGPINAKERGGRGGNNRGSEVIVINHEPQYQSRRGREAPVFYRDNRGDRGDRGNHYAYGRPYHSKQQFYKAKKRKKMRKMRRMRRLHAQYDYARPYDYGNRPVYTQQHVYDRPVIIIPLPRF